MDCRRIVAAVGVYIVVAIVLNRKRRLRMIKSAADTCNLV